VASLLPLRNFYSILIRLLEPSSSEAGETWVRNMAAEFCLQLDIINYETDMRVFPSTKLIHTFLTTYVFAIYGQRMPVKG
jgi:hypothetical protein